MRKSGNPDAATSRELRDESKTLAPRRCARRLDAGPFAADVASFRLLAAENKAKGTLRIYTQAPTWFAAAHLLRETGKTRWEQVDAQDVQRWVAWLLGAYSGAYARQQYRALRQFFRWLSAEDEVPDPTARLRAPAVAEKPVPFSPAENFPNWPGRAGTTRSHNGATRRSFRYCGQPASGSPSWRRSATTPMTAHGATWTWGAGRSGCGARAAGTGP